MFAKNFVVVAALTGLASALPTEKRADIDTTVLQFALTLEHLENVFYKQAIEKFSLHDFEQAGYSADYYNNLQYIAYDEQEHVEALSAALTAAGVTPNQACTYDFPYTDVPSFITLSSVLEDVGTAAYLGGAGLITSKAYLTVAGSILAIEARHTAFQRNAIHEVPMPKPFQTPLDPTSVYTLAAMFIKSCPKSNAALPFTPFPTLATDGKTCTCEEPECGMDKKCSPPSAGADATFTANSTVKAGSYVTFVSGLNVVSVAGKIDGNKVNAAVPAQAMGQTYVFVTSKNENGTLTAADIEYGPAILEVNPPAPALDCNES